MKTYMTPFERYQAIQGESHEEKESVRASTGYAKIPFSDEVLVNSEKYKRAESMSPLVCWHERENKMQQEGRYNEIDGNELKAALMGVKNKWFGVAQENRRVVEDFLVALDKKNYDKAALIWKELKEWKLKR